MPYTQRTIVTLSCLVVILLGGRWDQTSATASELRRSAIVAAVEQADPSVVNIHGRKTVRADATVPGGDSFRQVNGMGTGVVIDQRGFIITNYHVVEGVGRIQVSLHDGTSTIARLIAHDPRTDLAIIKISVDRPLPVIRIGTATDLRRGETVIAVGNAYGYDHTVTRGIVSSLKRPVQVSDDQRYQNLIQTDASINPGNSGGPLLNIDGDMVGINVAVRVGAQGIGFAIPADEAMQVASKLLSIERIDGTTHGVTGKTKFVDGASQFTVTSVQSQSPADTAGLRAGDVIKTIGGLTIERGVDIERALLGRKPSEETEVVILRDGKTEKLPLVLARKGRQQSTTTDLAWRRMGLKLAPVPPATFRQYNSRYRGGLKVLAARSGGPGDKEGIRRGDVLVGIHKWETISLENISFILQTDELEPEDAAKFYVLRGTEILYGYLQFDR